jgi:membrane protein YqaA with SNARE-associated domain
MVAIINGRFKAFIIAGIVVVLLGVLMVTWLNLENPQIISIVKDIVQRFGLVGVFAATIVSGSVIPFGSPIIVGCAAGFGLNVQASALIASTGYTLGVLTSYVPAWILGERYVKKKMSPETFQRYAESWNRRGYKLCVLFSLVPGFPVDLLAVICGCFHTKAKYFLPLCWVTLTVQFTICAWLGKLVGSWIF